MTKAESDSILYVGRWRYVHIAQCRGFVTNGVISSDYCYLSFYMYIIDIDKVAMSLYDISNIPA